MFINIFSGYVYPTVCFSEELSTVDKSSFRPDSEQVRALKFNPQGSGSTPVYDYPDGKVPKDDPISPEIIALRSGRLDKADVEKVKESIIDKARYESDSSMAESAKKALTKVLGLDAENSSVSD